MYNRVSQMLGSPFERPERQENNQQRFLSEVNRANNLPLTRGYGINERSLRPIKLFEFLVHEHY